MAKRKEKFNVTWGSIFRSLVRPNPEKVKNKEGFKQILHSNKKMKWNIYNDKIESQHFKKFNFIHYVFKYKFFVPMLFITRKIIGKYLVKKVPNKVEYANLRIFDKAFEKSLEDWYVYYLQGKKYLKNPYKKNFWLREKEKNPSVVLLRDMKELILTMTLNDTAYLEFMNILQHKLAQGMIKYHKVHKTNIVYHAFYNDLNIYDTHYIHLQKTIQTTWRMNHYDLQLVEQKAQEEKKKKQEEQQHEMPKL